MKKESELLRAKANEEENDLKYLGLYTKMKRAERFEKFDKYKKQLIGKGYSIVEYESIGKYSITSIKFGVVDFYPKANKILLRKSNTWKEKGLDWIIKNLLS